jgi:hypothetical protein
MSFGRRRGFKTKIVDWTKDQVTAAYHHVHGTRRPTDR